MSYKFIFLPPSDQLPLKTCADPNYSHIIVDNFLANGIDVFYFKMGLKSFVYFSPILLALHLFVFD